MNKDGKYIATTPVPSILLALSIFAFSCNFAAPDPTSYEISTPARWRGTVAFETREPTLGGLSADLSLRPARYVDIVIRRDDGEVLARTRTDGNGHFEVSAPTSATELVVQARVRANGNDIAVYSDTAGAALHELRVPARRTAAPVLLVAREKDPSGTAGALHILDTMVTGFDAVARWTGRRPPPLWVGFHPEMAAPTTYLGQWPHGSSRFAIWISGGADRAAAGGDSDEHDDAVILHELGHFIMDRLATHSSVGGPHSTRHLLDPGFAWEEGRATWFSAAVRDTSLYIDTVGVAPRGGRIVALDLEGPGPGPRGEGSEFTVASILWDLTDGAHGSSDVDGDGVSLGPAALLNQMFELELESGAYPSLGSFLAAIPSRSGASPAALREMLVRTGQPAELFAEHEHQVSWPADLRLGQVMSGKLGADQEQLRQRGGPLWALTSPQVLLAQGQRQSIEELLLYRGEAIDAYRIFVPSDQTITLSLDVRGATGAAEQGQDLDLELRDLRADLLAYSSTEQPLESITYDADQGWYVVYVRLGTGTSGGAYDLRVEGSGV